MGLVLCWDCGGTSCPNSDHYLKKKKIKKKSGNRAPPQKKIEKENKKEEKNNEKLHTFKGGSCFDLDVRHV